MIEGIATSASLAHSIGAAALRATKSSGHVPIFDLPSSSTTLAAPAPEPGTEGSVSLAALLEPTNAGQPNERAKQTEKRRRPGRSRRPGRLARLGLSLLAGLVAATIFIAVSDANRTQNSVSRSRNVTHDPRTKIAFSSDGVERAATAPPSASTPAPAPRRR